MKKLLIAFTLTFSFMFKSFACLNGESYLLKDGTLLYEDVEEKVPHGHEYFDDINYNGIIKRLDSLYKVTKDLDYLSDKGVVLVLLKKYNEAITLYLEIEKKKPNRYSTASNIGTAYELVGQNEKALKWIKRAVEIDADSHFGSEWIHVKILEAKIKGEQFYTTSFLLNTNFGVDSKPNSGISQEKLTDLHTQLFYQLNERMSFVKPKDKLVAQLLFDLGNTAYELGWYHYAYSDYQLAINYGFEDKLIDSRIQESIKGADANHSKVKVVKKEGQGHLVGGIIQFMLPLMVIGGIFALLLSITRYYMRR